MHTTGGKKEAWLAAAAWRQTFKSVKQLASFALLGKGERLAEEGKLGEV